MREAEKAINFKKARLDKNSIVKKLWRGFLIGFVGGAILFVILWKLTWGQGVREWRIFLTMPGLLISLPVHILKDFSTQESAYLLIGSSVVIWGIIFGLLGILFLKIKNRAK